MQEGVVENSLDKGYLSPATGQANASVKDRRGAVGGPRL